MSTEEEKTEYANSVAGLLYLNSSVGDYNFEVISDLDELEVEGTSMHNAVFVYYRKLIVSGSYVILRASKEGSAPGDKTYANVGFIINTNDEGTTITFDMARLKYNAFPPDEIHTAIQEFCAQNSITYNTKEKEIMESLKATSSLENNRGEEEIKIEGRAQKPNIEFEDFEKLDIRICKILSVERVPKTDKLYKMEIDTGIDKRIVVSSIADKVTELQLLSQYMPFVLNLKPRTIKGIESTAMIIMAHSGDKLIDLTIPKGYYGISQEEDDVILTGAIVI